MSALTIVIRDDASKARAIRAIERAQIFNDEGKRIPVVVTFERLQRKRSAAQNRLYWMWLGMMCEHIEGTTGKRFSDEELHEWCKSKFLKAKLVKVGGKGFRIRKSTASLRTMEMSEYLEKIDRYAADELNFVLPRPEDLYAVAMPPKEAPEPV